MTTALMMKTWKHELTFYFLSLQSDVLSAWHSYVGITCYLSAIHWSVHLYALVNRSSSSVNSGFKMSLESSTTHCYCFISYTPTSLWIPTVPVVMLAWEMPLFWLIICCTSWIFVWRTTAYLPQLVLTKYILTSPLAEVHLNLVPSSLLLL